MQIAENKVVSFHYTLKDQSGAQLESSQGSDPMTYLHGHDSLLKGLEDALTGKSAGASFSVTLTPDLAFGELREDNELRVPISQLRGAKKWEPGMQGRVENGAEVEQQQRGTADECLGHEAEQGYQRRQPKPPARAA